MPFGTTLLAEGGVRFRLWAPSSPQVELELQAESDGGPRRIVMRAREGGWHEIEVEEAQAGSQYRFIVQTSDAKTLAVPDPASRSNPQGVHDASAVVDPRAFAWRNPQWQGRPWPDVVLYELHIGTFTQEGTFAAACRRLQDLKDSGVTALQLMPLAAFPGVRNWGYDGVLQFAPAACYGRPDDLKALVDAAHSLDLMVLLDVVYNHFGPDGNYLHAYCPEFFNFSQKTPWGAAINFDGDHSRTVRDFFLHNALYWIEEYCFDGLRLDAVHALRDRSSPDIVSDIARALQQGPGRARQVHLVLENNANQARYLKRDIEGRPVLATAQWDDDVHHSLHVLASGESDGYYRDYADKPLQHLGRALTEGFAYQGEFSKFRDKARGEPSGQLPPAAFIGFLQNHDMIGNRAFGDRIGSFADERMLAAAYACLLLCPEVPMLFMGEEFAASTPFMYFCDFGPQLAMSVSNGRRREFKRFAAFADEAAAARIPDPNAEATFLASKLLWDERTMPPHRARLEFIRDLLALRRRHLAPHLAAMTHGGRFEVADRVLRAEWRLPNAALWTLIAHFGAHDARATLPSSGATVFSLGATTGPAGGATTAQAPQVQLEPGAVVVTYG
jgi:maltooligosyltrehalose trehalohydrolase